MKMVYKLTLLFLACTGLASCGANSMFEAESMGSGSTKTSRASSAASVPEGCESWFDGCNTCMVKDGEVTGCTKMACKAQISEPACRSFAPGFGGNSSTESVQQTEQDYSQAPETIPETKRDAGSNVPENCKIWFDGCNSCVVLSGKLRGCTSKVCTSPGVASCTKGG